MTPFFWWYSTDGERYFGPHDTRDEAIEVARESVVEDIGAHETRNEEKVALQTEKSDV